MHVYSTQPEPCYNRGTMAVRLSRRFFQRSTEVVARALLGKTLVFGDRAGIIVETEAYLGPEDKASHARFGPTKRAAVMFGDTGVSYVYLCYGVHEMFNIVAHSRDGVGAVLLRGLAPLRGIGNDAKVAAGPGKLTRALGLSRDHNHIDMTSDDQLFVSRGRSIASSRISVGPRIGVDYAGDCAARPLRFWLADSKSVSRN